MGFPSLVMVVISRTLEVPVRLERITRIFMILAGVSQCEVEIYPKFGCALHVLRYVLGVPAQIMRIL